MKVNFKSILLLGFIIVAMLVSVTLFSSTANEPEKFTYKDAIDNFENNMVASFVIDGNSTLKMVLIQPQVDNNGNKLKGADGKWLPKLDNKGAFATYEAEIGLTYQYQLNYILELAEGDTLTRLEDYDVLEPATAPWYQVYLPWIILGGLLLVMSLFFRRP